MNFCNVANISNLEEFLVHGLAFSPLYKLLPLAARSDRGSVSCWCWWTESAAARRVSGRLRRGYWCKIGWQVRLGESRNELR